MTEPSVLVLLPDQGGIQYHARGTIAGARERNVPTADVEVESSISLVKVLRTARRVSAILKSREIFFVEIGRNEGTTFLVAILASWFSGRKLNVLSHDGTLLVRSPGAYLLARQTRNSKRIAYRVLSPVFSSTIRSLFIQRVSRWFVTSQPACDEMLAAELTPCFVMTPGLEDPISAIAPSQARSIVVPGFLGPNKGTDIAVDAWTRLNVKDEYYLHVIGNTHDGSREWTRQLHQRLIDSGKPFQWTVDRASDHEFQLAIANSAIVLVPYRESNPASGVVVRAVVEGRCIIGTAVPAVLCEVEDGESGVVISTAEPDALADAIANLVNNPQLRDHYGKRLAALRGNNRRWSDQFESIACRWR